MPTLQVTTRDLAVLTRLSADLVRFPLAAFEEAVGHALGVLAEEMDAANGFWLLTVRGEPDRGIDGWKVRAIRYLHDEERLAQSIGRERARIEGGVPNRHTELYMRRAGEDRAARPVDLMPRDEWEQDIFYREHYEPHGITDIVTATSVVHPCAEVTLGLHRKAGGRFSERERDLLLMAAVVLRRPFRAMVLAGGRLPGQSRLTRRELEVLDGIVTGGSEKHIATDLGIADRTVHQHAGNVYRKLGVSGRSGLLGLWSGRGTG